MEKFAEKVDRLMESRGVKAPAVAEAVGVDVSLVRLWLGKKRRVQAEDVLKLARYFGVSADYLLDDAMEEPIEAGITEDERFVLQLFRDLGLTRQEAVRGLAGKETKTERTPVATGGVTVRTDSKGRERHTDAG